MNGKLNWFFFLFKKSLATHLLALPHPKHIFKLSDTLSSQEALKCCHRSLQTGWFYNFTFRKKKAISNSLQNKASPSARSTTHQDTASAVTLPQGIKVTSEGIKLILESAAALVNVVLYHLERKWLISLAQNPCSSANALEPDRRPCAGLQTFPRII